MSNNNDDEQQRRTPRRLVYEAYERAAQERERVSAAPMVPDAVIDTQLAEVEYHAAVMEYFNRLKPHLPKRKRFWEEIPLWNDPLDGRRAELAAALAEYYGVEQYQALGVLDTLEGEQFPEFQAREGETVCGLKNLVHWRGRTEPETVTRRDVIDGEITETIERPVHLPREVAMRAHDALDEAAAELGYNVRPADDIPTSQLGPDGEEYEVDGVRMK